MDQYTASLAKACLDASGITKLYTDNVPSSFAVPSLYFPPNDIGPSVSALNNFQTRYTIYAKVFAKDRQSAGALAEQISMGIMLQKCRIPVLKENGKASERVLKIEPPDAHVIDEGVAQITLTFSIVRKFPEKAYPKAKKIHINENYS